MRFYVAGRFQNYGFCRWVMSVLREQGHSITFDWTNTEAFDENGQLKHHRCTRAENVAYAYKDLHGVREADILVLCADALLAGAYIEMGYALAFEREIYVVAPERETIFFSLPQISCFESYKELFEHTASLCSPQLSLVE